MPLLPGLYRDRDTYLRVNRRFSRLVLENAPGMVPMAACCEANGQNYSADYSALMAAVDAEKNRMLPGRADYAAPFALRDRTTNQPIVCRVPFAGGQRELTAESRKKWEKGQRSDKRNDGNRLLDEMTTEWQEESLLAVIHADGNNMGVKIQQKLNGSIDYDFCVSTMRAFTAEIADAFTRTGETSLRDTMAYLQKEYHGLRETAYHYRIVVADGDDFTFICNARFALEYTCNYLKAVHQKKDYSSCAGICIFHSGYPVARAYTLAEQACDNAKKPVHETHAEECWLDFHYLHSGIDGNPQLAENRRPDGPPLAGGGWQYGVHAGKGEGTDKVHSGPQGPGYEPQQSEKNRRRAGRKPWCCQNGTCAGAIPQPGLCRCAAYIQPQRG